MSHMIDRMLMAAFLTCACMTASSRAIILANSSTPAADPGEAVSSRRVVQNSPVLPEGAVARLTVEGTPIDQAVARLREQDSNDFYLSHDAGRTPSPLGAAYLSRWDGARDSCVRIFGHHLGDTDLMFSPISDAHDADVFQTLGPAILSDPAGPIAFTPLCALLVDKSYAPIRQRDYSESELEGLVTTLLRDARVSNPEATHHAKRIDRLLVLITCSSDVAGRPERTLVVFAHIQDV